MASGAGNIGIQADTVLQLVPFDSEDRQDIIVTSTQTIDVGGSAYVLSGELQQPGGVTAVRVALKVFPTMLSEENQELLRRELNVCRTFRHPLLLPFLGTSAFSLHTILVSYYMANGNLREYLARNPDANRRAFVLQVAEAVHFLHDSKGYVHGDLKCHNVLVTDDERAILADFGLATTIEKAEHETTTATGIRQRNSLRFAAPEILIDEASGEDTPLRLSGSFEDHDAPIHASAGSSQSSVGSSMQHVRKRGKTPPSDVYAFGMVVLEIFTGELPWTGRSEAGVITRVVRGDVPPKPLPHVYTKRGFTQYYWDLCLHCWSFHPQDRPSMNAIVHKLSSADDASASYGDYYRPTPPAILASELNPDAFTNYHKEGEEGGLGLALGELPPNDFILQPLTVLTPPTPGPAGQGLLSSVMTALSTGVNSLFGTTNADSAAETAEQSSPTRAEHGSTYDWTPASSTPSTSYYLPRPVKFRSYPSRDYRRSSGSKDQ